MTVAAAKHKQFTWRKKVGNNFNALPEGLERALDQMCAAKNDPAMWIPPNELIGRKCRFSQGRHDRMNRDRGSRCELLEHIAHHITRNHARVRDASDVPRDGLLYWLQPKRALPRRRGSVKLVEHGEQFAAARFSQLPQRRW